MANSQRDWNGCANLSGGSVASANQDRYGAAGAIYSKFWGVALNALEEVEVALTNERLFAQRLPHTEGAVSDHTQAVRVANLRYRSGSMDLLSVLQLQEGQIQSQAALIELRNDQLANRINLHLALGGGFDISPATAVSLTTAAKKP